MVIKGGMISWANMGDPNASLPTPQPCIMRPMFGAFGEALEKTRVTFTSQAAFDAGIKEKLGLKSIIYPVHGMRQLGKADMVLNGNMPQIEVNPETFDTYVDGKLAYVAPAKEAPLGQLYWFS